MLKPSRSFQILDRKERVKLPYRGLEYRPVEERVRDFEEVTLPFDVTRARYEASRCLHCPQPSACTKACPVHNDIPRATWLIEQGAILEAARLFRQTSSFPEVCGRVCPHEHLCEGACVLNKMDKPIHIGALEAFATDYERRHSIVEVPIEMPTGKKVAVVGGGPSGLACAELLARFGHAVTVFDSKPLPGGLLLYGIPGFKLSNEVLFAKLYDLVNCGIKFVNHVSIGTDKTIDDLFGEGFQAVYIAVGAGVDVSMNIPGEDLPGIYKGTEFLIQANVDLDKLPSNMATRPEIGQRVVVIGGGDTSSDCLRSALRMGAKEVTCVYRRSEEEMPGATKDRLLARQEGAQYHFLTQPVRFIAGDGGRLAAMECIRMELGEPDASGRRRPVPVEGSNFILEADTAILAIGYWPHPSIGETTPGLETRNGGQIVIDEKSGATSRPGVFAGGDAVDGPSLVATAMAGGRRAAFAINDFLTNRHH